MIVALKTPIRSADGKLNYGEEAHMSNLNILRKFRSVLQLAYLLNKLARKILDFLQENWGRFVSRPYLARFLQDL